MYEAGRGGFAKDDAQAVSWYRKAAEFGDPVGMTYLGDMYAAGRGGLAQDDAQARHRPKRPGTTGTNKRWLCRERWDQQPVDAGRFVQGRFQLH
jgi:hypothetical protein